MSVKLMSTAPRVKLQVLIQNVGMLHIKSTYLLFTQLAIIG